MSPMFIGLIGPLFYGAQSRVSKHIWARYHSQVTNNSILANDGAQHHRPSYTCGLCLGRVEWRNR